MTEVLDIQHLLVSLKDSKLLPPEDMARIASAAASSGMDGAALGPWLVANGFLTGYQLDAISARRFAELRIGNYEVLGRLGEGGMGTVFKARHARMKRLVALKVLSRALAADSSFVRRFQREVETIARLSHPNVVMAFDADEADVGPFLVMEYVNGRDLHSIVDAEGPVSLGAGVDYVLQAARGLQYAHGQGIIHRDIKPANLLRDASGVVKVADLGLARLNNADSSASGLTQSGGVLGSAHYMSPEQAEDSSTIDCRADIYSLGATLYFLLVGRPPYDGANIMAVLLKHRNEAIPSLTAAGLPAAVDEVFRRMVAKAPADRYQTMAEVVRALEAAQASIGAGASITAPRPGRPAAAGAKRPSAGEKRTLDETREYTSESAHRTIAQKPPELAALQIVLVEPSRTQSGIIRKYLQDSGILDVVAIGSGQQALERLTGETPQVVISALHLPDMTGVQLAERIRASTKNAATGFVLVSSEADSPGSLSKCGNAMVLQKPFTAERLREALQIISGRSSVTAAVRGGTAAARGNLRVLIADDSAAARVHIKQVLARLGLSQFAEAADGAQAVAAVARQPFDLIVTDYNMPLLDGGGLVAYLRQNPATAAVPIVMVTTEKDPAKLKAVGRLGVTAVCDKSFAPDVVEQVIDSILRAP